MEKKITLVVVDFQYDFCLLDAPLYVPGSDRALWNISSVLTGPKISRVIFTADWHPADHCSFKENGGEWNRHCLQFSKGAAVHELLLQDCIKHGIPYEVLCKGTESNVEEYGVIHARRGARAYDKVCSLHSWITIHDDEQLVLCGLAGDYCVLSCLDNLKALNPMIYLDGVASIDGGTKLDSYIKLNNIPICAL